MARVTLSTAANIFDPIPRSGTATTCSAPATWPLAKHPAGLIATPSKNHDGSARLPQARRNADKLIEKPPRWPPVATGRLILANLRRGAELSPRGEYEITDYVPRLARAGLSPVKATSGFQSALKRSGRRLGLRTGQRHDQNYYQGLPARPHPQIRT